VSGWPESPPFAALAAQWGQSAATRFLRIVWASLARFSEDLTFGPDADNLERRINEKIYDGICAEIDFEPFKATYPLHEPYEFNAQSTRPPQPDFAFVIRGKPHLKWPIEGKVLPTSGQVGEYVKEIENFTRSRYGRFSTEGALLGYLISGVAEDALAEIADRLRLQLESHPDFADLAHRTSEHLREDGAADADGQQRIRIHHLIQSMVWLPHTPPVSGMQNS
jgi:hypothetical protein